METETEKQRQMEYIYIHYHKLMLKVAYNIVKNREDAQDVVQQALLQMMSNPSKIENTEEKRLRGYVLTTVHNCAIDLLRRQTRLQSSALLFQEACILDQPLPMIHICLENLPENYRNVLLLKHRWGYSSEETARILHLSEVNVIKIDQRAKKKLEVLCRDFHLL